MTNNFRVSFKSIVAIGLECPLVPPGFRLHRKYLRVLWVTAIFAVINLGYSNCSPGFKSVASQNLSLASSSAPGAPRGEGPSTNGGSSSSSGSSSSGGSNANTGTLIPSGLEGVKVILSKHCTACHYAGQASGQILFNSVREFEVAKLIVPGSVSQSKLVTRLKKYPANIPGRNMPPGPSDLTDAEYATIVSWIESLPVAAPSDRNRNVFSCDPNEAPDRLDVRRLSKVELYNTLFGLLNRSFGSAEASSILNASPSTFRDRIPNDSASPFSRSDRTITTRHSQGYFDLANEISSVITTNSTRMARFLNTYVNYARGSCSTIDVNNLSINCYESFVKNLALRAWGRPMERSENNLNNEWASFQKSYALAQNSAERVGNAIFRILLSPSFLNHVYLDGAQTSLNRMQLSNYAIARKLSFHFMRSNLDEGLLSIAEKNNLSSDSGFAVALNYASQRSGPMIEEFVNDWLEFGRFPESPMSTAKYAYITNGIRVDANLIAAMKKEIVDLVSYVDSNGRSAKEILTSNISFARDPNLMKIYGLTSAAPSIVTEANAVRFPASHGRSGIPSRAAYLFSPTDTEQPILRSVHLRKQFLCQTTRGIIPPGASSTPLPGGNLTTREKFHQMTQPASCVGCHAQINPPGFAFSQFNAIGAFQMSEPVFSGGSVVAQLPVDAQVELSQALGIAKTTNNGAEFNSEVADSPDFKRCMSQWYESYSVRLNDRSDSLNSCSMQRMFDVLAGNGSLRDFFRATAHGANYRLRTLAK